MEFCTLLLALCGQKGIRDWKSVSPVRRRGEGHTLLAVLSADDQLLPLCEGSYLLVFPLSVSSQVDRLAGGSHLLMFCKCRLMLEVSSFST
jgi:hypothetical protein